jgi:hypothetical protein
VHLVEKSVSLMADWRVARKVGKLVELMAWRKVERKAERLVDKKVVELDGQKADQKDSWLVVLWVASLVYSTGGRSDFHLVGL